eukprot:scaffold21439_cov69-Phaeocystis_antarctica.AAC.1
MSIQGAIESWNSLHQQLGLSRSLTSTKASSIHVEVGRVEPKPARQVLGRDDCGASTCACASRGTSCARSARAACAAAASASRAGTSSRSRIGG